MMLNKKGWWFPDGDKRMSKQLMRPWVDGRLTYQHNKYLLAKQFVRKYDHAVDVGAHIGLWSCTLVKNFKRVTAFEPVESHRECFMRNLRTDDWKKVTLHPFALGGEPGAVELLSKPDNSGVAHVLVEGDKWPLRTSAEVRTLDSFELTDVDFLKIDVEGFDYFVVAGGEETIRRWHPAIIVEQKPLNAERYGVKQHAAVDLLKSWGAMEMAVISGDHILQWP